MLAATAYCLFFRVFFFFFSSGFLFFGPQSMCIKALLWLSYSYSTPTPSTHEWHKNNLIIQLFKTWIFEFLLDLMAQTW